MKVLRRLLFVRKGYRDEDYPSAVAIADKCRELDAGSGRDAMALTVRSSASLPSRRWRNCGRAPIPKAGR